MQMPP